MSVARRSNGAWIVKFKDEAGRWRQRQFKEEAAARAFDAAASQDRQINQDLSLREVVISYLRSNPLAEKTIRQYVWLVNGGPKGPGPAQHLGDKYAKDLTRADLESVREHLRAAGNAPASINIYVGRLKSALNWAASEEFLEDNPWRKFRSLPGARHKSRAGTLEEVMSVMPHLPEWLQWAARTAIALCLRPGVRELFSLEWSSFNWKLGSVSVYMPKVKATKTVYAPKGYMAEAFARHNADPEQPLVCPGPKGRKVTQSFTYIHPWKAACQAAGVSIVPYALRHVAASEMLAAGADLAAVAAQLGHRNITTTGAFYTHAVARAQQAAATMLPMVGLVGNGGGNISSK